MIPSGLSYRLSDESLTTNYLSLNFIFRFLKTQNAAAEASGKTGSIHVCVVCVLYDVFNCLCCINVFVLF